MRNTKIGKMMEVDIPAKFGTVNQNNHGTRFWVEPAYSLMDAIYGDGIENIDMIEWATNTFSPDDWDIDRQNSNRFYFKQKSDRTAFMLKWC